MNEFPQFHPGEPALVQLSSVRLNKISLGQKSNQIQPGTGYRVTQTPGGTTVSATKTRVASPPLAPLTPFLRVTDAGVLVANVTPGFVNERVPGTEDAVNQWIISNLKDGDKLRDFAITVGQQISVVVYVKNTGAIGGDAEPESLGATIFIEAEGAASTHYDPICGDDEGASGEYHYSLGVLRAADGNHNSAWIDLDLGGSHIDHFRERPMLINYYIDSEDGRGEVVGKYDHDDDKYKFRVIDPVYGLKITQTEDVIRTDFDAKNTGGADGCKVLNLPTDDPLPNEKAKFRQIRQLNSTEEGIEGIDHQINVEIVDGQDSDAGALDTIRVRGNGKKATFTFMGRDSLGGFEERGVINFEDGLCTDNGDFSIDMADYFSEGF